MFKIIDLPWLPPAAEAVVESLKTIRSLPDPEFWPRARFLANHALSFNQTFALQKVMDSRAGAALPKRITHFKLAIVSNGTTDLLTPFLSAAAMRHGIRLEILRADFDQGMQEALDPSSRINAARPDAILLAMDHRGLPLRSEGEGQWPPFSADAAIDYLSRLREAFRRHSGAVCLVQNLPAVPALIFGSYEAALPGSLRATVEELNARLAREVASSGDVLVDVNWLAQCVGLDEWYDDRQWLMSRLPFSNRVLPIYGDFVARVIAAMRGKARKCLILDLDNTVWGGVIGDDGLDGIALGMGDAKGEAFRSIQQTASDLRRRGVVLAVCSKNDEKIAREAFRSHADMILREEDIAVFIANWNDKASNIELIAKTLELGLDAMVLLDDNPAERSQVRSTLPDVAVPEIGEEPAYYARTLLAAGYFETIAFTREDLARADDYKSNADRTQLQSQSRDLGDFLQSLQMQVRIAPFDAAGRKRITQLVNKTNQFNVATKRYTEQQIAALEGSAEHFTLQIGLKDRFGDNGMIAVIICQKGAEAWEVDTWLMSCRVLNRRVEDAVLNHVAAAAKAAGARSLLGTYIPTERNGIVADLFQRLGFTPLPAAEGSFRWQLDLSTFTPADVPMTPA